VAETATDFLKALQAGTADQSASILLWHLVYRFTGTAKLDIAAPKPGWSLRVQSTPDARYIVLIADGEPER